MPALHAEAAADLAGDDAQLGFRDVEDAARHVGAGAVRALGADIKREAAEPVVPLADAAARLHRGGGDAVEDELEAADVMGAGEGRLDGALVAEREEEALVVGAFRPELRGAGRERFFGRGDGGQRLVLDLDQLRRVLREIHTLGDDKGDGVADQHRAVLRQRRARWHEHRRAVAASARNDRAGGAEFLGRPVFAGQHREHARHLLRGTDVDGADARMRMGRAQHKGVGEARQYEVVGVAAATGQQPRIFGARHRLAQREFHRNPPIPSCLPGNSTSAGSALSTHSRLGEQSLLRDCFAALATTGAAVIARRRHAPRQSR